MAPEEYRKLPSSLLDINVTGGEPFLRKDLPEIIKVLKETCPKARLVISSNGFLENRIRNLMPEILTIDDKIGVRISIDGYGDKHEEIRGISGSFKKCLRTLNSLKRLGLKDLGIGMTVMNNNINHIDRLYELAEILGIDFSITVATSSSIYFGEGKSALRPRNAEVLKDTFRKLISSHYLKWHPKKWFRGWFEKHLLRYIFEGKRPLPCDAGVGFFYLDSLGNVFACHILPTKMGNIREKNWQEIWGSRKANLVRERVKNCQKCWMVCTAKSEIKKNLVKLGVEVVFDKLKIHTLGRI